MIEVVNLTKSYDGGVTYAVRDTSLTVQQGELVVLLGESGCGKTTTLKSVNRLVEPTSGRIHLDGEDVASYDPVKLRRKIGYVFQGIGLFPHLSVVENMMVVPHLLGWSRADLNDRAAELFSLVGLDAKDLAHKLPGQLSGGQQQRVGVARALAARSKVLLMDEPFGALDPITRDLMQEELLRLRNELGLTILMVTHDMTEALLLADRIAVMKDGTIRAIDTPTSVLKNKDDDYVAQLMATPLHQAAAIDRLLDRNRNSD